MAGSEGVRVGEGEEEEEGGWRNLRVIHGLRSSHVALAEPKGRSGLLLLCPKIRDNLTDPQRCVDRMCLFLQVLEVQEMFWKQDGQREQVLAHGI